jgi:5-deoxy-D-glucuronate isomerase
MLTSLLSKDNAPLHRLALQRLQLDAASPWVTLHTGRREGLLYSLVGAATVVANGASLGLLGTRRRVTEPYLQAVRFPAHTAWNVMVYVEGYGADLLYVTCAPVEPKIYGSVEAAVADKGAWLLPTTPYLHWNDAVVHEVGEGTHQRQVRVLPCPLGYTIEAGETLNRPGAWSSWPRHATPDEAATRYAEHEECFYIVTPGYGLIRYDGYWCTGERATGVQEVHNNQALATPLGAHEITFSPDAWGWYAWFYHSFLQKTYNKYAHEGIRTYVR